MNSLSEKLQKIALEAFESLCQIFPTMEETKATPDAPPTGGAIFVDFTGPIQGRFTLSVEGHLRKAIAQSMLETTPSSREEVDAIKEIANVICGNMLPYVAGPLPVFKLAPPHYEPSPEKQKDSFLAASTDIAFTEGSAHLSISLFP